MSALRLLILVLVLSIGAMSHGWTAGSGAGAGGSGHQRAINSGLPPGEAGPAGAPNNSRPAETKKLPSVIHGSPRPETTQPAQ